MYPQSMFKSKKKKNIIIFHPKINIFTAVKYCCILHGRVCVMSDLVETCIFKDSSISRILDILE